MGRNNKQRRATKRRRQRANRRAGSAAAAGGTRGDPPPDLEATLGAAVWSWDADPRAHEALLGQLDELAASGLPVFATATARLHDVLDDLWRRGWTPADVVHVTARRLTGAHADIVSAAAIADGRRRAESDSAPHGRWLAQLDVLSTRPAARGAETAGSAVRLVVAALGLLTRLPPLPPTMPHPGQTSAIDDAWAGMDQRMLARVRGLLAKAESTEFDEEAEALTAKAQELITRYAIADALLHTPADTGEPSVRRVPVNNPYPDAKASLLSVIADANRCQAVHSPDMGWVTLFGYDGDLDAVELLAASLQAQATNAMARQGSRRGRDGRSTTRSFRRAFLYGFAIRIGERLRTTVDDEVRATGSAQARLLPVLAEREDRVDAAVTATFPEVERRTTQITNATGWSAGQAAADLADLGASTRRLDARQP
ncbi:MAG: DUF2786 domain-containing protein [Actinobacteria bacterium]|nr:DUF2786 domain-containing protein [Actinomycetota bacterium]